MSCYVVVGVGVDCCLCWCKCLCCCVGVCFAVCLLFLVVVCRLLLWFVGCLWLWFVWCLLLWFVLVVWLLVWTTLRRTPLPQTSLRRTAQNFALFFSVSRHQFRSFSLSLCVFSLNFGFCDDRDPQMCTYGLSGCGVEPRRLRGRRGFTQQPENSKRAHLTAPVLPNTSKIPREDTQ